MTILQLHQERIVVTGASGFLGTHLMAALRRRGAKPIAVRSRDYDLRQEDAALRMYKDLQPTILFHLAAEVGGIGANQEHPGQFFFNNLAMGLFLIEHARRAKLKKFISVGTVCSYPKNTAVPFREEDLWLGYPEETNAPYGLAKKMQLVQLQAYQKEFGFCGVHLLPSNLYGPWDHFDPQSGHVIPAMVQKIDEAQRCGLESVTLWGDGSPTREFLYVADCAEGLCLAAERYSDPEPVNLGTGVETSIRDLIELISQLMGYSGSLHWDTSRPNGQPRRSLNVEKAATLFGFRSATSLYEGLSLTVQWYRQQAHVRSGARGFAR